MRLLTLIVFLGFSHEVLPPVPPSAPPHVSPVPPPLPPPPLTAKKPASLRKESPLLLGLTSLINTGNSEETSLDCGPRILKDQLTKGEGTGGRSVIQDDTSSVGSGSFAEIDDIDDPDGSIAGGATEDSYRSKSQTPDPLHTHSSSTLPSRGGYRSLLLTPVNTLPAHVSRSARNSPEKENLYASIPAAGDEEYLTMRSGVSLEDILAGNNKSRSTSMPNTAQSVIGKLKSVTSLGSRSKEQNNVESSPHHSPSPRHNQKVVSPSYRPFQSFDEASNRGFIPVVRPLPPSPNKMNRRAKSMLGSPTKRKISSGGDNNIYESIDENEEWFKQLRQERVLLNQQKMEKFDPELATKCNAIMSHFLQSTQVQELWLEAVRTAIPDFNPPTDASIPPLSINPEYIIRYARQSTQERQSVSSSGNDENKEQQEEEEEEVCSPPEREEEAHKKLTVTDSVLIRMNRSLQQLSSTSSSSSTDSESEESDDEESDQEGNEEGETEVSIPPSIGWVSGPREDGDTLRSETTGSPLTLAVIHQQHTKEDNDFIMTCDGNAKEKDEATESEEEEEFTSNEDEREGTTVISDMIQSGEIHVMHSDGLIHSSKKSETSPIFYPQTQTSPSIVNGHLSVCQLNSLDSGISATNGVADETD